MKKLRAISIRQPFAEQIMAGMKKAEYRSRKTEIRERVYASLMPRLDADWKGMKPKDVPLGKIVGTVEVAGCRRLPSGEFKWMLKKPERHVRLVKPKVHPQPVWFFPFGRPRG